MATGVTYAACAEYVAEATKVSLWLADWLERRDGLGFDETMSCRTDVYRLTVLWDGKNHPAKPIADWREARWDALLAELGSMRVKHGDDVAAFEAEGLALLWPIVEPRIEARVRTSSKAADRPFGFFSYDLSDQPDAETITIHMDNPFAPDSPFRDMAARGRELRAVLDDAEATHPTMRKLWTGTWMNSYRRFLELFPAAWRDSASDPTPLDCWANWWGQMTSRTGGFHWKNGQYLRDTGRFPYACVKCSCGIAELREHLCGVLSEDGTH